MTALSSRTETSRAVASPRQDDDPVVLDVRRRATVAGDLRAAVLPWLAARLLVGATLVAAHIIAGWLPRPPEPLRRHVGQGLLGWDAERYLQIATQGYEALPLIEVRFFPLLPLLTRLLDVALPGGAGFALLAISNVSALGFGAVLHRLALVETGDVALARRAAWFAAITPASFVFVWGYTEPLWCLLAAGSYLAARRNRWGVAALLAFGVGLIRPVGVLLAVPLLIEVVRAVRRTGVRPWLPMVAAAAPAVGTAAYLAWMWRVFGDPLLPYTIQQQGRFRGAMTDPLSAMADPASRLVTGQFDVHALRMPWAVILLALVAVTFRRWPVSCGAFALAALVVALSTTRLGSFERYGFTVFPIMLTLAAITHRPNVERFVVAASATVMVLYGLLALLGAYVP